MILEVAVLDVKPGQGRERPCIRFHASIFDPAEGSFVCSGNIAVAPAVAS